MRLPSSVLWYNIQNGKENDHHEKNHEQTH